MLPFPWEQFQIFFFQEPVIEKQYDPFILRCPDHTARRLQDLVHSRILVGKIESLLFFFLKISPENLLFHADHRESRSDDHGTDEPLFLQVDPLREHASHDAECRKGVISGLFKFF